MSRKVRKPFTFSNGFQAPVGMTISAHLYATHHDETLYPHADEFDGFRFVPVVEDGGKETGTGVKKTMYTTSPTYLAFGHGRHAWCVLLPGSLI
jgi:cytochrome P450